MSGDVEKANSSSDSVRLYVRRMDRMLSVKKRSIVSWTAVGEHLVINVEVEES